MLQTVEQVVQCPSLLKVCIAVLPYCTAAECEERFIRRAQTVFGRARSLKAYNEVRRQCALEKELSVGMA